MSNWVGLLRKALIAAMKMVGGVMTIWGAFLDLPPPTNRTDEGGQGGVSGLVCPPGGNNEDGGKELRKVCKAQRPASQESSAQAIAR